MGEKFLIVATGFNCSPFVKSCYDSILKQTHKDFIAVLISDGSTDSTARRLKQLPRHQKIFIEIFSDNQGAACRRFQAIKKYCSSEKWVVGIMGLDDRLFPHTLQRINDEYHKGVWMTYGNWVDQYKQGLPKSFPITFPDEIHRERSYRSVTYRATAMNTFKRFLFDQIPEEDFHLRKEWVLNKEKWIDSTTESELVFSCLEMCGKEKIGVIHDKIYFYNRRLPGGTLARLGTEYKYKILAEIVKRKKKPLLNGVEIH